MHNYLIGGSNFWSSIRGIMIVPCMLSAAAQSRSFAQCLCWPIGLEPSPAVSAHGYPYVGQLAWNRLPQSLRMVIPIIYSFVVKPPD